MDRNIGLILTITNLLKVKGIITAEDFDYICRQEARGDISQSGAMLLAIDDVARTHEVNAVHEKAWQALQPRLAAIPVDIRVDLVESLLKEWEGLPK